MVVAKDRQPRKLRILPTTPWIAGPEGSHPRMVNIGQIIKWRLSTAVPLGALEVQSRIIKRGVNRIINTVRIINQAYIYPPVRLSTGLSKEIINQADIYPPMSSGSGILLSVHFPNGALSACMKSLKPAAVNLSASIWITSLRSSPVSAALRERGRLENILGTTMRLSIKRSIKRFAAKLLNRYGPCINRGHSCTEACSNEIFDRIIKRDYQPSGHIPSNVLRIRHTLVRPLPERSI